MTESKFAFKDTLKENLALAVYNTGYERCSGGHKWGPALRDHYLVHYVHSGKGTYTYNGKTYTLHEGDLFLMYPMHSASYTADQKEPWEYSWVGFNGTEARRMLSATGFSEKNPILHPSSAGKLPELLLSIYRSSGNTPAADADMAGYLYLFLAELMRTTGQDNRYTDVQDYLMQALRYIQYNFSSNIQVNHIASYVGISRSQLYRAFMEKFELSPHEYLKRYRINEACTLLHRAGLTVSEVAGSVGFSDPLYFSRVFKEVKGMTPTAYQQKHQE